MVSNTLYIGDKVIRLEVRLAAMINESTLISVEGGIYAQREEVITVFGLMLLVKRVIIIEIIHIEKVAHAESIIDLAPLVTIPGRDDLPDVFQDKSPGGYKFLSKEPPHHSRFSRFTTFCINSSDRFLDSSDEDMPFVTIILLHQEVGAQVFIARAAWMTLVESE